jgi:Flp pilus assembly protein TadD
VIALLPWLLGVAAGAVPPVMVQPTSGTGPSWLGVAVAQRLPRSLSILGVPVFLRPDRLRVQEILEIPAGPLTRATSVRIAEAVGVGRLVVGEHRLQGDQVVVSLRVLDVQRGVLGSPFVAEGSLADLPRLLDGLAWDIALAGPDPPSGRRADFLARRPSPPIEAFRTLAEALEEDDPVARRKGLERAVALAPGDDDARLALGRDHLRARRFDAALAALGTVPDGSPFARESRFLQGVALLEAGRSKEALDLYASLAARSATPAVLNNQGLARLRTPGSEPAVPLLRRAVEASGGARDLVFNLGWALLSEGDPEAAAFWLRGVVQEAPDDLEARRALAWALHRAGHVAEAREEWKALAGAVPAYESPAAPDLARRYERVVRSERLPDLDLEGRSDAELAAAQAGRAERLLAEGEADAAYLALTRAAYLDPYSARIHRLLARAREGRGEVREAVGELRMSLWCRDDPAVRGELATLLLKLGQDQEARIEARRVLEVDPANARARAVLEGN